MFLKDYFKVQKITSSSLTLKFFQVKRDDVIFEIFCKSKELTSSFFNLHAKCNGQVFSRKSSIFKLHGK